MASPRFTPRAAILLPDVFQINMCVSVRVILCRFGREGSVQVMRTFPCVLKSEARVIGFELIPSCLESPFFVRRVYWYAEQRREHDHMPAVQLFGGVCQKVAFPNLDKGRSFVVQNLKIVAGTVIVDGPLAQTILAE